MPPTLRRDVGNIARRPPYSLKLYDSCPHLHLSPRQPLKRIRQPPLPHQHHRQTVHLLPEWFPCRNRRGSVCLYSLTPLPPLSHTHLARIPSFAALTGEDFSTLRLSPRIPTLPTCNGLCKFDHPSFSLPLFVFLDSQCSYTVWCVCVLVCVCVLHLPQTPEISLPRPVDYPSFYVRLCMYATNDPPLLRMYVRLLSALRVPNTTTAAAAVAEGLGTP